MASLNELKVGDRVVWRGQAATVVGVSFKHVRIHLDTARPVVRPPRTVSVTAASLTREVTP